MKRIIRIEDPESLAKTIIISGKEFASEMKINSLVKL
jgi:hypothetical protein